MRAMKRLGKKSGKTMDRLADSNANIGKYDNGSNHIFDFLLMLHSVSRAIRDESDRRGHTELPLKFSPRSPSLEK
jgi:hypothetical protein